MRTTHPFLTLTLTVFACVALAAPAIAQLQQPEQPGLVLRYQLGELIGEDGGTSKAQAINNTGQIVGTLSVGTNKHAGHWHLDSITDLQGVVHFELLHPLPLFNQGYAEAYDISDADQIVGTARTEIDCPPQVIITTSFLLRPAVLSDLGEPYPGDALVNLGTFEDPCKGAFDSVATGISNANHIVGWADTASLGTIHAFLVQPENNQFFYTQDPNEGFKNDLLVDLGTLPAAANSESDPVSSASAVNDYGQVTGYSYTNYIDPDDGLLKAAYHAFIVTPVDTNDDGQVDAWSTDPTGGPNGYMTDIHTLTGVNSWGRDINNDGQIVGEADVTTDGGKHFTRAFVWQNGEMVDLGTLYKDCDLDDDGNCTGTYGGRMLGNSAAAAINSDGIVVGWSENNDSQRHGFVVVPEVSAGGELVYYRDDNGDGANDLMLDLNDPNESLLTINENGIRVMPSLTLAEARDINDDGQIVGWGSVLSTTGVQERGFLLAPRWVDPEDLLPKQEEEPAEDEPDGVKDDVSAVTDGAGTPAGGEPISGTPNNLTGTPTNNDTTDQVDTTPTTTPGLCGVGALQMLPLLLTGMVCLRVRRR